MPFLTLSAKMGRRMLSNVFSSSDIDRTHPNWSKTNRVCQKITSPSLNRDFLENFIFQNFQLSFPTENEMENHHFPKSKNWKKCKILIFVKSCLESFWWCFSANLLVWGYLKHVFFTLLASEHIFLPQGGIFLQKCPRQAKFSSKMAFSEILTKRPRGKKSWNLKFV